ncbi:MAG: hypothetical protein PHO32_05070, partial [Candidatus Cloacimonetes bacterium]|nr:hypothetical protein [Candidatus Cloacimonadota bacterium]
MDNFAKLIKKADNHRDDNLPIDTNKSGDRLTQTLKEILIIHTWGIGDLILLTPVLRAISHLHPWIKISMLFFPKAAALPILESPYVHEVLFTKWNLSTLLSTLIKLRRKKYHAVMFSSGVTHWKAWLFMLLLRAESRIGEYSIARLPGLTAYIRFNPSVSRTQANYSLFKALLELPAWKESLELKE